MTNIESNLPRPNKQANKVDFRVFILWDHNFVVDSGSWRPTGNRFKKALTKSKHLISDAVRPGCKKLNIFITILPHTYSYRNTLAAHFLPRSKRVKHYVQFISNYPFSSLYFAQIVWLFWQLLSTHYTSHSNVYKLLLLHNPIRWLNTWK